MVIVGFLFPGAERRQGSWAWSREVILMLMGWPELLQSLAPLLPHGEKGSASQSKDLQHLASGSIPELLSRKVA